MKENIFKLKNKQVFTDFTFLRKILKKGPFLLCLGIMISLVTFAKTRLPSIESIGELESENDYYVSTTGSDANAGTFAQPFASIQHAVNQMAPNSTLYIRGGTYREVVDVSNLTGTPESPITITAYNGEEVIIDGTVDITTDWTLHEGNIYKTTIPEDITSLYVEDELMTLARFPNALAYSNLAFNDKNRLKQASSSPNGTVTGATKLANTGIDFTDCIAILNFKAHVTWNRLVKNHSAGSDNFKYNNIAGPIKSHDFYFEGGLGAAELILLDSPQEWAYDETTNTLYFWAEDGLNPTGRYIRGKRTGAYSIIGDANTKYLTIDNIKFFSTTFYFKSSDHISIQNCDFEYPSESTRAIGDLTVAATSQFKGFETDRCENITVYNCTFQKGVAGLRLEHCTNSVVENNFFYRMGYAPIGLAGTVNLRNCPGVIYRRNSIAYSGDAMGVLFNPQSGDLISPWVCEYNFHTMCGLVESDGSSVYAAHEAVVESVGRYNWFIDNNARDYRWDGNNRPKLLGVDANFYRNVLMCNQIKGIATAGDGARLKGDFYEIYNNIGIYNWSDIDVSEEKGGNDNSLARNNAATLLSGDINDPTRASSNIKGANMGGLLRDPDNWDFRPKATATKLIDQGTITDCSVNGEMIDITAGFNGAAPDIGAYEYGDTASYWISGRQEAIASMGIPRAAGNYVKLDTDLMYLIGLNGVRAHIYLGINPNALDYITSKTHPENIVKLSDFYTLESYTKYYWRVDTELADGSIIRGDIWPFTTMISRTFPAMESKSICSAGWVQNNSSGHYIFNSTVTIFRARALLYVSSSQHYANQCLVII